jgi:class 3 adenylate cyclase
MFTDIVGFTAWSSEREASQVFILLQNIFHEFDRAAKRRVVFKVETIGDSYVAVTGLPEPQDDHAFIMIGFALECRQLMRDVTRRLEKSLGPETGDLRKFFFLWMAFLKSIFWSYEPLLLFDSKQFRL